MRNPRNLRKVRRKKTVTQHVLWDDSYFHVGEGKKIVVREEFISICWRTDVITPKTLVSLSSIWKIGWRLRSRLWNPILRHLRRSKSWRPHYIKTSRLGECAYERKHNHTWCDTFRPLQLHRIISAQRSTYTVSELMYTVIELKKIVSTA